MIFAGVLTVVLFFAPSETAKILAYYPIPSISHQAVYSAFTEELATKGHEVTVITTNPSPNPPRNLTQIDVHDISYEIWQQSKFTMSKENKKDPIDIFAFQLEIVEKVFDSQLSTPDVTNILTLGRDYFDLIIGEALIPFAYSLANKFDAPTIGIASMSGMIDTYDSVGAPTHPILYQDVFSESLVSDNIWKKLKSIILHLRVRRTMTVFYKQIDDTLMKKYYGPNAKTLEELTANIDLLILNSNPLFTGIRPVPPNTVLVNGLQLKKSKSELPQDLKTYLDNAAEGVVYFSLGTNALAKNLSPDIQNIFKEAFKQLPYKVIWKYELDEMAEKPDNVEIMKWVPQVDLLGHQNIKAFIMQGGQQSIDEAIFNKVPIVGIPVLGDQGMNVQRVVHHGLGVGLNLKTLTSEQIVEAVHRVIDDKSFKDNIKKFSELLDDQPETPLQRAVWWTEYVIRHKGAQHLRSPAAGISNWEYFMMDVVLLVLGLISFATLSAIFIIKKIVGILRNNNVGKLKKT